MAPDPWLRAAGLCKSFPGPGGRAIPVLQGVDLALGPGETVAIVGRSGSGKSTLLNLLGALDRADAGELHLGAEAVRGASRRALARLRGRHLGFVFQSFHLIPSLSAWDNVLLAARYGGADRGDAARRAGALFEQLGIADRRAHLPPALSGGEQQRVAFCRAVLNEPRVILADEPTGNLDEDNARVILGELRARAASGRSGVVLVTHDLGLARTADRVLELIDGRLR